MKDRAVSARYAKALFELASKNELELKIEDDLRIFLNSVKAEKGLGSIFQNPVLSLENKKSLLIKVAGVKKERLVLEFLMLLIEKGRFGSLESILESYHELLNASRHFEEVTITTARPIGEQLRKSLEKVLERKIGEKIVSETKVDPALLGGINIQIRNRRFDGSIRSKLDDLQKQMLG